MTPRQRAREGADRTIPPSLPIWDTAVYAVLIAAAVTLIVARFLIFGG